MPFDWERLLALAPLALGKPGNPRSAAMMAGYLQSQDRRQQEQLRLQAAARQDQMQQEALANTQADNARADEQLRMQQAQQALARISAYRQENQGMLGALAKSPETILPPDADPLQAQNVLTMERLTAQQDYGVPRDTPQGQLPNMTAMVSEAKKRRAAKRYEAFSREYKDQAAESERSLTDAQGEFAGMTFAAIRELAQAVPPAPSVGRTRPMAAPGSFEEYIDAPPARQAAIRTAKQGYAEAGRAPTTAGDGEPLVAVMGPDNTPVLVPRSQAAGMRPASTREQGRPVLSSDANRVAELKTSLDDVAVLKRTLSTPGATGVRAKAGAMLPSAVTELTGIGSAAKQRQATIDRVKQVIGKALEGGVLRKEDEYKYVKILPTIQDPPEVAASKLTGLEAALTLRLQRTVESLTDAGYDTGNFQSSPGAGGAVEYDYVPGRGLVPKRAP